MSLVLTNQSALFQHSVAAALLQNWFMTLACGLSVTRKKSPNLYKSCSKRIDFDTFTKSTKNGGDLVKLIVAKGFKKLLKVQ